MVGLCICVFVSVCLLVTFVSPAKMAEPIKVQFGGLLGWVRGTMCHMGVQMPQVEGAILRRCPHIEKHWESFCGVRKNG